MQAARIERCSKRDDVLQIVSADLRGRFHLRGGSKILQKKLQSCLRRQKVLQKVSQLDHDPQKTRESQQAKQLQVRRLRKLRLSEGQEQHG